jgi:hypothetical protein
VNEDSGLNTEKKPTVRVYHRKRIAITACLVVALAGVIIFGVVDSAGKPKTVVNEQGEVLKTETGYDSGSIVPGDDLPSEYKVDEGSPYIPEDAQDSIVTELVAAGKPVISISEQKLPEKLDFVVFYDNIIDLKEVKSDLGKAVYGTVRETGQWIASIEANEDWILIYTTKEVTEADMVEVIQGMRRR